MKSNSPFRRSIALIVPAALALGLSGCTLLGVGAAAGAAVGGCALLDQNEDDRVTDAELSRALYDAWDTDADDMLTEEEFEAGIDRSDVFADWSGDFGTWDTNDSGALSESEFASGVGSVENAVQWTDRQCDKLGL